MAGKGTMAITAAAALAVVAVASGGAMAALAAKEDPRASVAPVDVGPLAVAGSMGTGEAPASGGQQVAALDRLEGTLEHRGDDADDFSLGAVELEFGPEEWVLTAGALEDYDRDGTPEKLLNELDGLVGQPITAWCAWTTTATRPTSTS